MNTFYQQFLFEFRLFFRDKVSLFWNFIFPLFFLLLFGALNFGGSKSGSAIDFLLPGMIGMAILSSCIITSSISFVLMREKGYYRRMAVVPINRFMLIAAQVAHYYIVIIIQALFLTAVAIIVFSASLDFFQINVFILISFGLCCFLTIGFLIGNLTSRVEAVQPIAMIVFFLFLFLGGSFWPPNIMPGFLQTIASFMPSTYFVSAMREMVMIDSSLVDLWKNFLYLFIWGIVCLGLTIKLFRWE